MTGPEITAANDPLHEAALRLAEEVDSILSFVPTGISIPSDIERVRGLRRAQAILSQVIGEVERGDMTRGAR